MDPEIAKALNAIQNELKDHDKKLADHANEVNVHDRKFAGHADMLNDHRDILSPTLSSRLAILFDINGLAF
jgi:hypothetical protein